MVSDGLTDERLNELFEQWINGNHSDIVEELIDKGKKSDFVRFTCLILCTTLLEQNWDELDTFCELLDNREEK